jgi:hypothetical protein
MYNISSSQYFYTNAVMNSNIKPVIDDMLDGKIGMKICRNQVGCQI